MQKLSLLDIEALKHQGRRVVSDQKPVKTTDAQLMRVKIKRPGFRDQIALAVLPLEEN